MIYKNLLKRILDFSSAFILLAFFSPIFILATIFTYTSSPGGVIFKQVRVGKSGVKFELLKFRTMYVNSDRKISQTRQGDPDITPAGSFMRRFKIDELPQLFNVLKGEMSLVGPRPCLPLTAEQAPHWALKRFEVVPGLTGLAQVNGNINLSWEQRWQHDITYVDTISFYLDCKIIFKTIFVVIFGEERFRSIL